MLRNDLGDEKHFVAAARDCLADDLLGRAVAGHLCRIDVRHAQIEPAAQSGDGRAALSAVDVPGALTDDRDVASGGAEGVVAHGFSWVECERGNEGWGMRE